MSQLGPFYWDRDPGDRARHFQGLWLGGQRFPSPTGTWQMEPAGSRARAIDGTDLRGLYAGDPTRPLGPRHVERTFEIQLRKREDSEAISLLEALSHAEEQLDVFWGWWGVDAWSVALAGPGNTSWNTFRGMPNSLPGIDPADYQARARLRHPDGSTTDLTVIATSPVAAGEIVVPGGLGPMSLESQDLYAVDPGAFLLLYYPQVFRGWAQVEEWANNGPNDLRARVRFQEARS